MRLNWRQPGAKEPYQEALDAARAADVVIFGGGLNGDVEGEEMTVIYPGFAGGDRTEIALPTTQQKLLEDAAQDGQARRAGADDGIRAGRRVGEDEPAGDPRRLVSRPAGRQRHRRRAVRRRQPVRPPAGHLLQVGRPAAAVRRLRHEGPDVPLLHRRAALPVRSWPVLHALRLHGPADRAGGGRRARRLRRVVRREEHRHPRRSRGAAALRARPRRRAADAAARTARLRAHRAGAGRPAARVVPRHEAKDFAYYDEAAKRFVTAPGEYELAAGRSSADLPVSARVRVP